MPTIDVPVIDLSGALGGDPAALSAAAAELDEACRSIGFFAINGHGIPPDLTAGVVDTARGFFRLDRDRKDLVAPPSEFDFRGYLGMDTTSLAATLGEEAPADLCESFNVSGFDDPAVQSRAMVEGYEAIFRENLWPEEPDGLRQAFEAYQAALEGLCRSMLPIFAAALGLPGGWFDDKVADHTSLLLANWYPPVAGNVAPGQLRRGAHTDYGAFTVIAVEQIPGLQISVNGAWHDVPLLPGAFVVNLGDLMARWTNDRWVSTLHRVVIPDGADAALDRVSVPYFFQPSFGAVIETIPTTVDEEHPLHYEPVVAGEWITAKSMAMLEE
ncbi:MAG: 2-oxoglutarate and iron-dependent oxygenase domain-containing protein [Actinomycetota bacterium]